MNEDKKFMKMAIELSKKAKKPYGAIVVRNGKVVGKSDANTKIKKTIYNHAEMIAIENAIADNTLINSLKGAILYSSCEPCMMCMEAIMYSGIEKIVYGAPITSSNLYYNHLEDFSVLDIVKKANPKIKIKGGVLKDEALKVINDYNYSITKSDEKFIDIAIDLSAKSFYPFGAIVVRDGKIIGKSSDNVPIKDTIYTHAELIAIESAVLYIKDTLSRGNLHECTLYTSCEPCMMCQEAIITEGISRVVYAASIEDSNKYFCKEFPAPIEKIIKRSNSHIKIISELHRDKAVDVLKKHDRYVE